MLGLSRWSEKGGSYRTIERFFNSTIDWGAVNWMFIKTHLIRKDSVYLLGGDEVVVRKDGKHSYGLDLFYSSLENRVRKSLAFLNLSLIGVEARKAYPLINKQIIKESKEGCIKDKGSKKEKNKKKKGKRGRPKGSGNKDKKSIELSPYLKFVQDTITEALKRIDKHVDIVYFVFDGAFGNNYAVQMVKQCGLELISKLQKNSALCFPNEEYSGRGAPKKYGEAIDYKNLPEKYLKSDVINEDKHIQTKIYQMDMLHRKFSDILNIVIIQKIDTTTGKMTHVNLFSTDLTLGYGGLYEYQENAYL